MAMKQNKLVASLLKLLERSVFISNIKTFKTDLKCKKQLNFRQPPAVFFRVDSARVRVDSVQE